MRILLVEDDAMIGAAILAVLRGENYAVDWVRDGVAAEAATLAERYDLVLLDLGLPKADGLTVLCSVRARRDTVPVLVATARDAVGDRVAGLDAGADDYIVKPYDTDELLARVRALLRRSVARGEPVISHKGVELNPATREASLNGQPLSLTPREWALLEPMLQRPGVVFSRPQLEQKLYSWKDDVSSNAVEVYVHGLRKKLGAHFIRTVRGLGYVVPRD